MAMAKPLGFSDDDEDDLDVALPAIDISNRIVQRPSTSNTYLDDFEFVTDDEKVSLGKRETPITDGSLEDFLRREDDLRKLMSMSSFNHILMNDVSESEKDEDEKECSELSKEDEAILNNLESKLLDIQKRYNALMNVATIESETEDEEEEDKVEEDLLEFEDAHKKLEDIDKCLETITNEKENEITGSYSLIHANDNTKYIEKEYLNSLNEMTKKLDSLAVDEFEEFLDTGLLSCDIPEMN